MEPVPTLAALEKVAINASLVLRLSGRCSIATSTFLMSLTLLLQRRGLIEGEKSVRSFHSN